uniref:CARD domain-containing protein n=1 Tax=Astyanax mexicanus TaxID=7994 RepID=A0A8B9LRN8_ASTMX
MDRYQEQLQKDALFLCSDQHVDTELLDKLVLQLNRIYPQILTYREAQKFRNLSVPAVTRLAELLSYLQEKGEEACHEFYRALHLHNEDLYLSLPTRVSRRGKNKSHTLILLRTPQDRPPQSSYYYLGGGCVLIMLSLICIQGEPKIVTDSVFSCTVLELGQHAKHILLSYSKNGCKMD